MQKSPLRSLPLSEKNKRMKPCLLHLVKQNSQRNLRMKGRQKQSPQKKPKRSKACLVVNSGIWVEFWRKSGSRDRRSGGRGRENRMGPLKKVLIILRKKLPIKCSCCSRTCVRLNIKIGCLFSSRNIKMFFKFSVSDVLGFLLLLLLCLLACFTVSFVLLSLCIFPKREGSV